MQVSLLVEFIDLLIFNIVVRAAIVSKNSLLEFNNHFCYLLDTIFTKLLSRAVSVGAMYFYFHKM